MAVTERILPALMAVVYGALLIAAWGFTSLLTDTDVITEPDAGPLLGPAMGLAAVLVTWAWLGRVRAGGGAWQLALGAAASSWFIMLLVGGVGYSLTRGAFTWVLLFAGKYAASLYLLAPAVLAALIVVLARLLIGRSPGAKSFDPR
jgi:hypothetical protein